MKKLIPVLLLCCFSCAQKNNQNNISISLIDSNHSLQIKGLDHAIMTDIARDTTIGIWQSLMPVYAMPADTELKDYQPTQPGRYTVKDSAVVFTPDTPFKSNQTYYIRYYLFGNDRSIWYYIKTKKRPGSIAYHDLLFKY